MSYHTGLVSSGETSKVFFDFSNSKYKLTVHFKDENRILNWASNGGCKDGYAFQMNMYTMRFAFVFRS